MPAIGPSHLVLPNTLRRFATDAALVARLASEDPTFRGVCDDYELAADMLARLLHDGGRESETSEYRMLATELEEEIRTLLQNAV